MTEETTTQQGAVKTETASTTEVKPVPVIEKTETTENKTEEPTKKDEKGALVGVITALRHDNREIGAELAKLKAENEALKAGKVTESPKTPENLTEAEINRRAAELAEVRFFNEKCDAIANKGNQEFPQFDDALKNLAAVGALGTGVKIDFLKTVSELPDAHKILNHLGNDINEAARIAALPPVKMALELAKIETTIAKPKEISKAPAPIITVTGHGGSSGDIADPNISMEEFAKIRQKQREERAKR